MKRIIFIPLVIILSLLTNKIWSQGDSLGVDKTRRIIGYLGVGGGPCTRGGNFELSLTIASSDLWGGSLNFKTGSIRMHDIPSDYGGQFGRIPPHDDFTFLTFNLVKKFSTADNVVRFGLESGPSWVHYNLTELVLNPLYPALFQYKYSKINTSKSTLGLSMSLKVEFLFTHFIGCELSAYTVINNLQTVFGLGVCFNLGKVREQ